MNNRQNTKYVFLLFLSFCCIFQIGLKESRAQDHDHEQEHQTDPAHTESEHAADKAVQSHEQVEHQDHEEHDRVVHLTEAERAHADLTIRQVELGYINKTIELPGEIVLNEDRVAHIVPRFPGVATKINKKVGDYARKGEVLATIESNESLTTYPITSLISGTVIDKHVTLGEFVSESADIFVVADLSTVWAELACPVKDADHVVRGQKVTIELLGNSRSTATSITYISPIYDEQTRCFTVRATIPNKDNKWRPGSFIKGLLNKKSEKKEVLILKDAVQLVDQQKIVFVPHEHNEFVIRPVVLGESATDFVQILEGLQPGERYVHKGAFEIKAKIVTSSLGDHAGHGH